MANVLELKSLIEDRLIVLKSEQDDLKTRREMLQQDLMGDGELIDLDTQIKELQKRYRQRKEKLISESPDLLHIEEELAEIRNSKKDTEMALTSGLLYFFKETGDREFEDSKGGLWKFGFKGKVKPTNQPTLFQGK